MPFKIAQSGLNAALVGLRVTANNIANAGTPGFRGSRTEFSDITSGGVRTAVLPRETSADHIEPADDGLEDATQPSDIDLTEQLLNMLKYAQQLEAQVDTIRTTHEAEQSVIDMLGKRDSG